MALQTKAERHSLGDLPSELILTITDFLPIESVACLAYTCKGLFHNEALRRILYQGFTRHIPNCNCYDASFVCLPARAVCNLRWLMFLECIERDLPGHLLCDYCQSFHPMILAPHVKPDREKWVSCPETRTKGMWLSWPAWDLHLQFADFQMVMNRFKYGKSHGVPIETLGYRHDWIRMPRYRNERWFATIDLQPKVVSGNLMLHVAQHMLILPSQLEALQSKAAICLSWIPRVASEFFKLDDDAGTPYFIWGEVYEMIESMGEYPYPNEKMIRQSSLNSGSPKPFDWLISVIFHGYVGSDAGLEIALHTWTNLGPCAHTFSPAWLASAWHANDFYTEKSVECARNCCTPPVSSIDKDWISSACITAINDPSLLVALEKEEEDKKRDAKFFRRIKNLPRRFYYRMDDWLERYFPIQEEWDRWRGWR